MGRKVHANHGRDHRANGPDPIGIDTNVYEATVASGTVSVTTPWTVETIPANASSFRTTDSNGQFFEAYTDGNSKTGIRILQEGSYHIQVRGYLTFVADSGTRMLPTYFLARTLWRTSGNWSLTQSTDPTANYVSTSSAYLPDNTDLTSLTNGNGLYVVGSRWYNLVDLNSGEANVPLDLAYGVMSVGGTENWRYATDLRVTWVGNTPGGFAA